MTKHTFGNRLPRKLQQNMEIVGEQIRLARLRRNLSIAQIAERATCSLPTVMNVEKAFLRSPLAFTYGFCTPCS